MTRVERFRRLCIPEPNSGCWLWLGAVLPRGYGKFGMGGRGWEVASRAAWLLFRGPIPDGLHACHKCDVPSCVNPDHLFLGTAADNTADMVRKGRNAVQSHEHYVRAGSHAKPMLRGQPYPCLNCKRLAYPNGRVAGRCHSCHEYRRRHGHDVANPRRRVSKAEAPQAPQSSSPEVSK